MKVKDLKLALGPLPDDMEVCIGYRRLGRTFGSAKIKGKKYFFSSAKAYFTSQKSFTEIIFVINT